ncbi:hypothetical protein AJ79_01137 [Helicocarpus griseus UAMH5409]|uniref:Asteroid domain-containing protein n=1 Tax=Helicocarpus griseus UAMH5409 TaxID=1447875 RepID=A0A2B7YAB4_9EURO|nr:hypothetical protein AJ79_01137 [Helicocarpus griseus UAMH5409]
MGIPHLTRHLLPHAQPVWLRNSDSPNNQHHDKSSTATYTDNNIVSSVVIDGPALVYHVYHRLLSWSDSGGLNPVDAQPRADEVSIGVMQFLVTLGALRVRVEKIYFDGALPLSKRDTRMERVEKSRQKLESFCRDTAGGFKMSSVRRTPLDVRPAKLFGRRPVPARLRELPETTFMVPTVIEDLKRRWSRVEIGRCAREFAGVTANGDDGNNAESIFAGLTEIVPGEADVYCAAAARTYNCAVLTGDSDLLVHDLGPEGSVIFLDSIESSEIQETSTDGCTSIMTIRATQLRPASIAKSLGVVSIQRLAYELKRDPYSSFSTLIQRAKSTTGVVEDSASYIAFMKEFSLQNEAETDTHAPTVWSQKSHRPITDPKLSELYAQYESSDFSTPQKPPHIYLPILIESHDRRAAWMQGSDLRLLAYSLSNLKSTTGRLRNEAVTEHMRKGRRIAPVQLTLLSQGEIEQGLGAFLGQVRNLTATYQADDDGRGSSDPNTLTFWTAFALHDILAQMEPDERPSLGKVRRFLELGYCGEKLEWGDIHLQAQVVVIMYSIRMLREVICLGKGKGKVFDDDGWLGGSVRDVDSELVGFPWLRDFTRGRGLVGISTECARKVVEGVFALLDECDGDGCAEEAGGLEGNSNGEAGLTAEGEEERVTTASSSKKRKKRKTSNGGAEGVMPTHTKGGGNGSGSKRKQMTNMFDILRQVGD